MYSRELIFEYENVLTENKPSVNPFLFSVSIALNLGYIGEYDIWR